jgi:hypothetical protein
MKQFVCVYIAVSEFKIYGSGWKDIDFHDTCLKLYDYTLFFDDVMLFRF